MAKYRGPHTGGKVKEPLSQKSLLALRHPEKGMKTKVVKLCEDPLIQKRKMGILRDTQIFCATSGTYIL